MQKGGIDLFLYEKELKEAFWKSYNRNNRAKRWQFECPVREGNADLVTIEYHQGTDSYQYNAFEFKLNDIKKVLLQAEGNIPYVNKSWIVIPIEKKQLILDRYQNYLKDKRFIGVIGVADNGLYEIIHQPWFKKEPIQSQVLIKVALGAI